MSILTNLTSSERNILKAASEKSQSYNVLAKNFREQLINRGCITSLTTVREFMSNENLMSAIKLNWLLGYSDQILPDNLSKGIVSDYDLLQIPPSNNDSIKTNDEDTIKILSKIRNAERKAMMRNIDAFIRNMGWVEDEEVEHKTKKRAFSKDEVTKKVDNLLDNSSTISSYTTGTLPNSTVLSKSTKSSPSDHSKSTNSSPSDHSMTIQESNNSTRASVLKVTNVPEIINIDDDKSEVTDSMDVECKKFLKKILNKNGDNCGIITYLDTDGDVQMNIIDEKKFDHVMTFVMEYDMKKNN